MMPTHDTIPDVRQPFENDLWVWPRSHLDRLLSPSFPFFVLLLFLLTQEHGKVQVVPAFAFVLHPLL